MGEKPDVCELYLFDLGYLLKEAAIASKATASDDDFQAGRAMAYYEVMSLLQTQAAAFDLPLEKLHLEGFDAESLI